VSHTTPARRPALGFIFVTLLIAILGMGLVVPVPPGQSL